MNFSKKNHNFKQKIIRRRKTLKKVNNLILLLIVLSLSMTSCKSDDEDVFTPSLPPITQTGANTFGCYIDGKLLVPRDGEGTFNSPSHGIYYHTAGNYPNYLFDEIEVNNYKGNTKLIIHIVGLHQNEEGLYEIKNSNCLSSVDANLTTNLFYVYKDKVTQETKYYCSIENTGTLTITKYDIPNRIVSGTFSCTAVNKDDSNDTIQITDGRFDFKWDTINNVVFP